MSGSSNNHHMHSADFVFYSESDVDNICRFASVDNCITLPLELLDHKCLNNLSCGALMLYGVLFSELINKRGSLDYRGKYFIVFPVNKVMSVLKVSYKTACKYRSMLSDCGLIHKEYLGRGKDTLIYPIRLSMFCKACKE